MKDSWYDVHLQPAKDNRPYERQDIGSIVFGSSDYNEARKFFADLKVPEGAVKLLYKDNKLLLESIR